MKQKILSLFAAFALVSAPVFAPAVSVAALDPGNAVKDGVQGAGGGRGGERQLERGLRDIINILLFVLGAIAVIMIVVGGLKYVLSNGDSNQITSAKNTILYSVIGLVVALLAYAIVNFVVDAFS